MLRKKYKIRRDKRGVWLTNIDLELLHLIWQHRVLSLSQLKFYCLELYGISKDTTEKKLKRWRKLNVVHSKNYMNNPFGMIYYRIGRQGVKILENEEMIPKGDTSYKEIMVPTANTDHFFATRDVVIRTLVEFKKNKRNIVSHHPSTLPYLEKDSDPFPLVVPDWILSNEFGFLNIELDTGSESLSMIEEKIGKYAKYASQRPDEIYHVLLVVLDDTDKALRYKKEYGMDRSRRIASVKDSIIRANVHVHSNLFFYVVSMNRAIQVASNIMTGIYPISAEERSREIEAIISLLEMNITFEYEIVRLNEDEFYLPDVDRSLYADSHLLFKSKNSSKGHVVLINIMEEGSVKCLDQIEYLNRLRNEKRFKAKTEVNKILAIYRKNEELQNDHLGKQLNHIMFGTSQQLANNFEQSPMFYQTVTQYKKEGVLLYER